MAAIRTEEPRFYAAHAGEAWAANPALALVCEAAQCTLAEATAALHAVNGIPFGTIADRLDLPRYRTRKIVERVSVKVGRQLRMGDRSREQCRQLLEAFRNRREHRAPQTHLGVLPEHENSRKSKKGADAEAFREVSLRSPLVTVADLDRKLCQREPLIALQVMAEYLREAGAPV